MAQTDPSAIIQLLSDSFASNSVSFAALALLIYDTLLTFPSEIRHIWCKTIKIGTVLYLLARYLPLGFLSLDAYLESSDISLEKCNMLIHLRDVFYFLSGTGVQALLLARTYAISSQNQRVLGVLGVLFLAAVIPQLYRLVLENCNPTISQVNTLHLLTTIGGVAVILFDTGVVMATISSSIETLKLWQKGEIWDKKSLIGLVIYQGFARYGFVLTVQGNF